MLSSKSAFLRLHLHLPFPSILDILLNLLSLCIFLILPLHQSHTVHKQDTLEIAVLRSPRAELSFEDLHIVERNPHLAHSPLLHCVTVPDLSLARLSLRPTRSRLITTGTSNSTNSEETLSRSEADPAQFCLG